MARRRGVAPGRAAGSIVGLFALGLLLLRARESTGDQRPGHLQGNGERDAGSSDVGEDRPDDRDASPGDGGTPATVVAPAASVGQCAALGKTTTAAASCTDSFPDIVAVGRAAGFHCSGIVVAPRKVLTARHCLPATRVLVGEDVRHPRATASVTRSVTGPEGADVALLELDKTLPVTVRARRGARDVSAPLGLVRMIGFGAVDRQGQIGFGIRRFVNVTVQGWGCDRSRAALTGCDPLLEMIIARRGEGDTCSGDSGGAVLEQTPQGFRLLAVTSRPLARAKTACGGGGVYVRVDRIAAWLDAELRQPAKKVVLR